ncbi:MAG: hypothetical protein HZC55_11875 [Verrucomicrobia bacterium]|nr:hypothetical protein [Verrucomicrobiota bacterium]
MNREDQRILGAVVLWLGRHAGFPNRRLSAAAEGMICVAALAAADEAQEQARFLIQSKDPAQAAALRTHGLRRSQVHFKCDNSAKV